MTEAPIPMATSEARVISDAYVARVRGGDLSPPSERELRAIEVVGRVAGRARSSSVAGVDAWARVIRGAEMVQEGLTMVREGVSTATTGTEHEGQR